MNFQDKEPPRVNYFPQQKKQVTIIPDDTSNSKETSSLYSSATSQTLSDKAAEEEFKIQREKEIAKIQANKFTGTKS